MSYRFFSPAGCRAIRSVLSLLAFAAILLPASGQAQGTYPYPCDPSACNCPPAYTSPYTITYTCNAASLTVGFDQSPRNNIQLESSMPYADWYVQSNYSVGDVTWGPPPAQYPAVAVPADAGCAPAQWMRERLVATATKYIGYFYQHHHIPDWNPPADWPYNPANLGCQTAGIDCSDFSSWYYNYGLGIKLATGVLTQSEPTTPVAGPGGVGSITPQVVAQSVGNVPPDFNTLCGLLQTGDLLYIKGSPMGSITHVIMWIGPLGSGPDPLIIDSHGDEVVDENGVTISLGIHLRPFRQAEWYYTSFDHAMRFLPSGNAVAPANMLLLPN